jgi:hypothetical protein
MENGEKDVFAADQIYLNHLINIYRNGRNQHIHISNQEKVLNGLEKWSTNRTARLLIFDFRLLDFSRFKESFHVGGKLALSLM